MDLHTSPLVCSFRSLLLNITLVALCIVGAAAQNSPPVITVAPTNQWVPITATAVLSVQASGTAPLRYQWQFNGADLPGADSATLTITNMQTAKAGDYVVHVSNDYGSTSVSMRLTALQVVAWGATNYGQCVIPPSATNLVAIAAGQQHSLALRADGTVVPWGRSLFKYPVGGVTNATAIAAAGNWAMAVTPWSWYAGDISSWGFGALGAPVASQTNKVAALSAGDRSGMILRADGSVYHNISDYPLPNNLGQVKAIAVGGYHNLVLRNEGTVAAWGINHAGQINVPPGLSDVVAIAAGTSNSLALKANGEVVAWGANQLGQTNVPTGLKDVVAIAAGYDNCMALTAAGQVHVWGSNSSGQTNVPFGLTNVIAIAFGPDHCVALMSKTGLDLLALAGDPMVGPGGNARLNPAVIGIPPLAFQWQREGTNIPGATAPSLVITNAQFADEGRYRLTVTNYTGSLVTPDYFLNVLDLGEALNATNLVWTTKGQFPWTAAVAPGTLDGTVAVCDVTNSSSYMTGILQTVVSGPGTLRYSTYTSGDIEFFVNGQPWSRVVSTTNVTCYLPWGNHVLTWRVGQYASRTKYYLGDVSYVPGATPPIVTNAPDVVLPAGTNYQLGVSQSGTPPLQYQWFFNGSLLPGASRNTLSLTNLQSEHAGIYTVRAQNETGSATSTTRVIVNPAAPQISSQPASKVMASGSSNILQVIASGTEPLAYQWKRNGTAIPGATSPTLALNPVQISDAGAYTVEVTNALGTASSSNATVTILTPTEQNVSGGTPGVAFTSAGYAPWFPQTNVTHDGISALQSGDIPKNQHSIIGTSIIGPATLSFWWKVDGDYFSSLVCQIDGVQASAIRGVVDWNQVTLLIGTGTHHVQWVMAPWMYSSRSDVGWLDEVTVTPGAVPASILAPLVDKTNAAGSTLSLSITASGTSPFSYQWKFNGTDIAGATKATLTVPNMQATNAGVYTIRVSNGYGPEVSSSATVTVTPAKPTLTQGLASMARSLNGSAVFQVTAAGTPPFLYTWFFEGAAVKSTDMPEFSVTDLKPSHAGKYQVKVENDYGAVTSAVATLAVHPSVVVDLWPRTAVKPQRLENPGDVIAIAAGRLHTSALRSDGTVISWGDNAYGQTNVPPGVSNAVAIAAGDHHTLALRADGSLIGWGDDFYAQTLPQGVQQVVAIAASGNHSVALQADGTVLAWGYRFASATSVPAGLSNVVAIDTSLQGSLAVLEDGSLVGWGTPQLLPGAGSNMVQAAMGRYTSYGLREDGTVDVWSNGQLSSYPVENNGGILALDANAHGGSPYGYSLLVYTNGSINYDGRVLEYPFVPGYLPTDGFQMPAGLTNVVSADAGYAHAAVLLRDGSPFLTRRLLNRTAPAGSRVAFYPGISGSQPLAYQWYHDGNVIPGATNLTLILDQVSATAAGLYHCTATNPLGSITIPPAKLTVTDPGPNPGLQLALSSQGTAGQVRLQVSGLSGNRQVVIYTSTDLLNWQPVSTNTPTTGNFEFIDQATPAAQRFYRATEQ